MKIPISIHQKTYFAQLLNQLNLETLAVKHAQEERDLAQQKKDIATSSLIGAANMVVLDSGSDEGLEFERVNLSSEKGQDYLVLQEKTKPAPPAPTTPNAG